MNGDNQNEIFRHEGFMILETDSNLTVYTNNNRIPIFVYLCFLLILVNIFFFYIKIIDLFGFSFLLIIAIFFIFIGLKNRVSIPLITINSDYIEFIGKEKIKTSQIKNIEIETRIKFYFNLLGTFFTYPHRVVFILDDLSKIDFNIAFALKRNAQNFISIINNYINK